MTTREQWHAMFTEEAEAAGPESDAQIEHLASLVEHGARSRTHDGLIAADDKLRHHRPLSEVADDLRTLADTVESDAHLVAKARAACQGVQL